MKDRSESATERLYYMDQKLYEFGAVVLDSIEMQGGKWGIVLDRTAFFPEGGGQYGDRGAIGEISVEDTIEKGGRIIHVTSQKIEPQTKVVCKLDGADRFSKMQNHSGEHIVSGIANKLYGVNNVGFHLGKDDVTLDFDKKLDRADILKIETLANRAVWDNIPIVCSFPSPEQLSNLEYRSKLELTENVRIVTIGDVDCCACCAPHVERTGEIGMIKLLDFASYKGGVRIHMVCGDRALSDYNDKYENTSKIAISLSAKQTEVAEKFAEYCELQSRQALKLKALQRELISYKAAIASTDPRGDVVLFDTVEPELLIDLANALLKNGCRVAVIFSGDDDSGYNFIAASNGVDLGDLCSAIRASLGGRCGGSASMIRGSIRRSRREIVDFINNYRKED